MSSILVSCLRTAAQYTWVFVKFLCLIFRAVVEVIVSIFPQIHHKDKLFSALSFVSRALELTNTIYLLQLKYKMNIYQG